MVLIGMVLLMTDGKYEDLLSYSSPPGPGWQSQGVPPDFRICIWRTLGCKGPWNKARWEYWTMIWNQYLAASIRLRPNLRYLKILSWRKPSSQILFSLEMGWLVLSSWYTSSSRTSDTISLYLINVYFNISQWLGFYDSSVMQFSYSLSIVNCQLSSVNWLSGMRHKHLKNSSSDIFMTRLLK